MQEGDEGGRGGIVVLCILVPGLPGILVTVTSQMLCHEQLCSLAMNKHSVTSQMS